MKKPFPVERVSRSRAGRGSPGNATINLVRANLSQAQYAALSFEAKVAYLKYAIQAVATRIDEVLDEDVAKSRPS